MDTSLAAFTGTTPYTLPAKAIQALQKLLVQTRCHNVMKANMANDRTVVCICFILAWQMINPGLQTVLSTFQVTDCSLVKSKTLYLTA